MTCNAPTPRTTSQPIGVLNTAQTSPMGAVIDYLVVLDRSAVAYAERGDGVAAFAELCVRTINDAMRNSGIDATFRLVGTMTLPQTMASVHEGLDFAMNSPEIATERERTRADIVTLCSEPFNDGTSGVAVQDAKRSVAYSSVLASAVSGYVAAHEVAHIFGCQHSRTRFSDPGDHPYAVGAVRSPYYTIMGYPSDELNAHELAPVFSGVETVWQGVPLGSESEDNVRKIKERLGEIATFGEYLGKEYYIVQERYEVDASEQNIEIELKTNDFCHITPDAPWMRTTPSYTLDDQRISISLEANHSSEARTGHITLSGSDGYTPKTITIYQSAQGSGVGIAAPSKEESAPIIRVNKASELIFEGLSANRVEVFALNGRRVFHTQHISKASALRIPLSSGVYLCKITQHGGTSLHKVVL